MKEVKRIIGLRDVTHGSNGHDVGPIVESIREEFKRIGVEPLFIADNTPAFIEKNSGRCGVAVAVSKCDNGFVEHLTNSTFRYRYSEVVEALGNVIRKHSMRGVIRWDGGWGIFVFNLYFKKTKSKRKEETRQ